MPDGLEIIQNNLIMLCEFTDIETKVRRKMLIFTETYKEKHECNDHAKWVVEFKTPFCENHEHIAILCDIHRHKFMTSDFDAIQCFEYSSPKQLVGKLHILSISTL